MQAGSGMCGRRSSHPQAWFSHVPSVASTCFLHKATQTKCPERVRPRLWDLCSWGSVFQAPQPPTLFSLVSPGSQMGAQNTSAQPSLRLSTCCLLLPGRCDPAAQLCAEPLVRSSSCCYISMERNAPVEWGVRGTFTQQC